MSGRDPASNPIPEPPTPGSARAKLRMLLPIAIAVAGLAFFLLVFWPDSPVSRHGHARHGHHSGKGFSPVGGGDREALEDFGNASVTQEGGSPVGGGSGSRSRPKAEGWWYQDKGKGKSNAARDKGDQWWYQDKRTESTGKKESGSGKDAGKSGPDDSWWHD